MKDFKYKRVLLKLSGEALANKDGKGLNYDLIHEIAAQISTLQQGGCEVAIVIGGGNIIRGMSASKGGEIDRANADYMGMLATVINAMGLVEGLRQSGLQARVMSSVPMERVCDTYLIRDARRHLSNGEVVVLGGGTGVPYFTTDTNASLRACELNCDCILKATKVDGVYDSDPEKNENAKRFDSITYEEVLQRELRVMDLTAISMCMDNNIPVIVFDISNPSNIIGVLQGEKIGTTVSN